MPPYQAIQPDFQNMLAQRLGVQPSPMQPPVAMPYQPQQPVVPMRPVGPVMRPPGGIGPAPVMRPLGGVPLNGTAARAPMPNGDLASQDVLRQRLGMEVQ